MRKKLIAANWKMYKTPEQAQAFVSAFLPLVAEHTRDEIVICPPFVLIPQVGWALRGSKIALGGQDMFWESEGPYTGAVSAQMLHAVGCSHVIIGHSERRQYQKESDELISKKAHVAHGAGQPDPSLEVYGRPQQLVDIGGRRLNLYCLGHGSPTVILEGRLGASSFAWRSPRRARQDDPRVRLRPRRLWVQRSRAAAARHAPSRR